MSELSDWALVALTGVLSGATILLAIHTGRLVKITKTTHEKSEASRIEPILVFDTVQPLADGGSKYSRFSVKNIGSGHARIGGIAVTDDNGKELEVKPHSEKNVIDKNELFHWDVFGVRVGDNIEASISYRDIRGRLYFADVEYAVI
jgi:hypothetical protein